MVDEASQGARGEHRSSRYADAFLVGCVPEAANLHLKTHRRAGLTMQRRQDIAPTPQEKRAAQPPLLSSSRVLKLTGEALMVRQSAYFHVKVASSLWNIY